MEYRIEKRKHCVIMRFFKDITIYQIGHFKEAFEKLKKYKKQNKFVLLDFEGVGFFDPIALGIIVAFSKTIRKSGGAVKVLRMSKTVKEAFDSTGLTVIYKPYSDLKEAKKCLTGKS